MPTIQEEISRVKELMFGPQKEAPIVENTKKEYTAKEIEEDIMSGLEFGYPDADSTTTPAYDFTSKGSLGSQPELEDDGFTEPTTNYSKIKKGYNFDSDGPQDSYISDPAELESRMAFELGEQDDGGGTGESDDAAGAGTASMGIWDSGVARGIANQIATGKWGDTYQPERGKANPLW